jgi:hypothetical protein
MLLQKVAIKHKNIEPNLATIFLFFQNLGILLHVGEPLEPVKLKMANSKEES